jgi:mRNA interferase MazF
MTLYLCQIASKAVSDAAGVPVWLSDIEEGALNTVSNVRPNKLFTADRGIVLYRIGKLKQSKLNKVIDRIIALLKESSFSSRSHILTFNSPRLAIQWTNHVCKAGDCYGR